MVVAAEVCPRRRQSEKCGGLRAEHSETTLAAVRHDVTQPVRPLRQGRKWQGIAEQLNSIYRNVEAGVCPGMRMHSFQLVQFIQ